MKSSTCKNFEEWIILDSELEVAKKEILVQHLASCTTCQEKSALQKAWRSQFNRARIQEQLPAVPTFLTDQIMHKIAKEMVPKAGFLWNWNMFQFPAIRISAMGLSLLFVLTFTWEASLPLFTKKVAEVNKPVVLSSSSFRNALIKSRQSPSPRFSTCYAAGRSASQVFDCLKLQLK